MKLMLLSVVAVILLVGNATAQIDDLNEPNIWEEAPIELEDVQAEFNASAAAAFSAYSKLP